MGWFWSEEFEKECMGLFKMSNAEFVWFEMYGNRELIWPQGLFMLFVDWFLDVIEFWFMDFDVIYS